MPKTDMLPRVLGPFSATLPGVGAMIGAGIFFLLWNVSPVARVAGCLWLLFDFAIFRRFDT